MTSVQRSIATLLTGTAVLFLGNGLLLTILPIRATLESFSTSWIGVIGAVYFAGFAIGCLVGPRTVKQVGHIRAFSGFAALTAILAMAHPFVLDPLAWAVLRGFTGLCLAVLFMVIESWLNEQADNRVRGRVLSLYIIVANLVTIGGQLMVNLGDPAGPTLFVLVGMLICLSLVPLSLAPAATPAPPQSARVRIALLYRLSPSGFFGCLAIGVVEGAFWTLGPVFAQERGLPVTEITLFMSAFVVGGTISQWPLGRYSDRVDRRIVIIACCLGTTATGLTLAFATLDGLIFAFALACLHGALMVPLYALCLAHANDYAPSESLVEVSSGLLLVYGLGAVLGPLLLGPAMDFGGAGALFLAMAVILSLLALFMLFRKLRRHIGEARWRGTFWPVPKTSQSVYELETDD